LLLYFLIEAFIHAFLQGKPASLLQQALSKQLDSEKKGKKNKGAGNEAPEVPVQKRHSRRSA
jgi:hypothetical protein